MTRERKFKFSEVPKVPQFRRNSYGRIPMEESLWESPSDKYKPALPAGRCKSNGWQDEAGKMKLSITFFLIRK
jgi:hypothetical protein